MEYVDRHEEDMGDTLYRSSGGGGCGVEDGGEGGGSRVPRI